MAILNVTINTDTNEGTVTVNDNALANISEISIYRYGSVDEPLYYFRVTTTERTDDVYTVTHISANDKTASDALAAGKASTSKTIPGAIAMKQLTARQQGIIDFFEKIV